MQKRILIVDDDLSICNSFSMLLRLEGYEVDGTIDSEEAAMLINKHQYNACFFDYCTKGPNGLDFAKIMRNTNPQCAVFIISGMQGIDVLCAKQMEAGLLTGIFRKPFDIAEVLQNLTVVLA